MTHPVQYSRSARRWTVDVPDGGAARCIVFDGRSFAAFVGSAARDLFLEDIERVLPIAIAAARERVEGATRLVTYLHLYLLVRGHERGNPGSAWCRRHYTSALGLLRALASEIPATEPPETNWLLRYRKGPDAAALWEELEHRVTRSRAETGHDEAQVLAAWLAARELLHLALQERDGPRLLRSLEHYKRCISGPQSGLVTKGPLRRVVEADILRIAEGFPEFLDTEPAEREFLENWFLARFSLRDPLRLTFPGKAFLIGFVINGLCLAAVALVVVELVSALWGQSLLRMFPAWTGAAVFVVALLIFAWNARLFRLFYPRLFAGAVLGWSTLLGTIASEVLLQSPGPETAAKSAVAAQPSAGGPQLAMDAVEAAQPAAAQPELSTLVIVAIVLLLVPWFFLYNEVFSTVGNKREAVVRALRLLGWALALVAMVGLVAHTALERLLRIGGGEKMALRMAVFAGGCAVSLYVAVVAQLVWSDRGVSATLGSSDTSTTLDGR